MTDLLIPSYSKRDPQDVLADLKQRLVVYSNGIWTDFLESDLGYIVLKLMVGLMDFNAYYTDAQVAECFLSLCRQRESAIRKAKELGYIPKRTKSSTVQVNVTFPAFNSQIDIAANSAWRINGIDFICKDPVSIPAGQTSIDLTLTQGTAYSNSFTGTGVNWYRTTLPRNASDISVSVNGAQWAAIDTWIDPDVPTSYKVYEDVNGQTIQFGADIGVYKIKQGDSVVINAVLSNGLAGNIETSDLPATLATIVRDGNGNDVTNAFTAVTTSAAIGGQDIESIQSIRDNAPAFYSTQGRCVTENDYAAVVKSIPGVHDCKVIGGEKIGRYGECWVIVYADSPYTVSSDFLNLVLSTLKSKSMITIKPIVKAPDVVEVIMTLNAGIIQNSYSDAATARNLLNSAITNLFASLNIGDSVYESDILTLCDEIEGVRFSNFTKTTSSFANSQAGIIQIKIPQNFDVTHCVLKDNSGAVLFSGDGTSKVIGDVFTFAKAGLTDQKCTLAYSTSNDDLVLQGTQVAVLKDLIINTSFVN